MAKNESKEIATIESIATEIDTILSNTPALVGESKNFMDSLRIAQAIKSLKIAFDNPQIKELVKDMQDSELGFLTDRPPGSDAEKKKGKYSYDVVKSCCINALVNGYRISNNEFNIISERMYPAKNGKFRRIIENPKITDFQFTTTPPIYDVETRIQYGKPEQIQFAKVKCYASWRNEGVLCTLGTQDKESGKEDTAVFKIKVNNMMGDDAILGKAHSKLFSRVLSRIEGIVTPDADIDDMNGMQINQPPQNKQSLKEKLGIKNDGSEDIKDKKQETKQSPNTIKNGLNPIIKEFDQIFDSASDEQVKFFRSLSGNIDINNLTNDNERKELLEQLKFAVATKN